MEKGSRAVSGLWPQMFSVCRWCLGGLSWAEEQASLQGSQAVGDGWLAEGGHVVW